MKITLAYNEDLCYTATNESGNELKIDMKPFAEKKYLSPMELLLSAFASCTAVDVVLMIKKRRKTLNDIRVEARGERSETHPRRFVSIILHFIVASPDLEEDELRKIIDLTIKGYCSVGSSLNTDHLSFTQEIN